MWSVFPKCPRKTFQRVYKNCKNIGSGKYLLLHWQTDTSHGTDRWIVGKIKLCCRFAAQRDGWQSTSTSQKPFSKFVFWGGRLLTDTNRTQNCFFIFRTRTKNDLHRNLRNHNMWKEESSNHSADKNTKGQQHVLLSKQSCISVPKSHLHKHCAFKDLL